MNEKVQEEEGPWEEVIKRRRWKITPQWNALPDLVLLNIFCKSELKDRLQSIPLVCKSWKHVIDDPRCFSSMIPDSVSPEDAFIKNTSGYEFESYKLKLKSSFVVRYSNQYYYNQYKDYKVEDEFEEDKEFRVGISRRLRTLIKKSGGGAAITTLYLSPFASYPYGYYGWFVKWQFEKILRLIANCCPNLKHISFEPFRLAPTEALLQLFNKCKKLELVDLSYDGYDDEDESLVIQEMGKCLPNLRGIRIGGLEPRPTTSLSIATYFPQLKFLSLSSHFLYGEHLSVILFSCLKLQYVYIEGHRYRLNYGGQDIVDKVSAQIPEFYFGGNGNYDYDDYSEGSLESMEDMLECKETYIGNDYCYISKQRKEDQYVCILKKDENVSMLKKKIKYYHILKKKQEKDRRRKNVSMILL